MRCCSWNQFCDNRLLLRHLYLILCKFVGRPIVCSLLFYSQVFHQRQYRLIFGNFHDINFVFELNYMFIQNFIFCNDMIYRTKFGTYVIKVTVGIFFTFLKCFFKLEYIFFLISTKPELTELITGVSSQNEVLLSAKQLLHLQVFQTFK